MERIIAKCRECKVDFKILPPIGELIDKPRFGQPGAQVATWKTCWNAEPVQLDMEQIRGRIDGQSAAGHRRGRLDRFRTGAASWPRFDPRQLVLLDRSENDLFKLGQRTLATSFPNSTTFRSWAIFRT